MTERVKDYFPDFRDLQEAAINAIYDICEDKEQSVSLMSCFSPTYTVVHGLVLDPDSRL